MTDSEAGPHTSKNLQPRGIERDLNIMDSALAALDSDDLETAEALAAGLGHTPAERDTPAEPGVSAEPGAGGGGAEQPSPDRPG